MYQYIINGGQSLFGEVTISGAKNAAVAIIPAALMVDGVCRIENIPQISDVTLLYTILAGLGAKVTEIDEHTVEIDSRNITSTEAVDPLVCKIRASYYLIGALLGRFGEATVAMPGGCNFGVRPIDQHVKGFKALGAAVDEEECVHAQALGPNRRLVGAICAAPSVLGDLGLLEGREATCYPGFESRLTGAAVAGKKVAEPVESGILEEAAVCPAEPVETDALEEAAVGAVDPVESAAQEETTDCAAELVGSDT